MARKFKFWRFLNSNTKNSDFVIFERKMKIKSNLKLFNEFWRQKFKLFQLTINRLRNSAGLPLTAHLSILYTQKNTLNTHVCSLTLSYECYFTTMYACVKAAVLRPILPYHRCVIHHKNVTHSLFFKPKQENR